MAAPHEIELNGGGAAFATLTAGPFYSRATYDGAGRLRGYVYNAGKRKVWINSRLIDADFGADDVERQEVVGIPPGMAVPLPDGCRGFSFKTARGFSALYWIPGASPPVFSMSMSQGENGLHVEDAKTAQALKDLAENVKQLAAALTTTSATIA